GGIARLDKSEVVAQADGRGMVLVNVARGGVSADFHSVPTVHLGVSEGRRLLRWARTHPSGRVTLGPDHGVDRSRRTAAWSPDGDPRSPVLKPDVVAAADGVLAAQPASTGAAWGLLTGSSAAAAQASGLAALLRARHDWDASIVRSTLVTTATPLPGSSVLSQGAGALGRDVPRSHLALRVGPHQWRRALDGRDLGRLNLPTMVLHADQRTAVRRVTNTGARAEYFSAELRGVAHHRITVRPRAVRLAPGESARFRVTVWDPHGPHPLDDGLLVLRGARGGLTRIPVALAR
ncbi:MAG: S8 family serine peptidase, partial [Nocardioides sp.]|nr:S8 family serine peptidase [Nocardioides sp.]